MKRSAWEQQAENWVRWSRSPGHDAYWDYHDRFQEIVPPPGRRTLEVGCGEGRVSRDLAAHGHRVTGIDSSPTLIHHAMRADSNSTYLVADAARLPFQDASFDLVVSYNSLMDLDDMPVAVMEASRVLGPDGRLAICVLHPLADAGRFESQAEDAAFVISGNYLDGHEYNETFERSGLTMTFSSSAYPLEAYARALEEATFLIELVREPRASEAAIASDPSEARWARLPTFLFLRAVKP